MRTSLVPLLALVSIYAGCATPPGGGGVATDNCDGSGACKLVISVTECKIAPPPDLHVTAKNVNIFWELDMASSVAYRFADDGIKLKQPSDEFDSPEPRMLNKKFKLHDKNSKVGEYKYEYAIKVQKLSGFKWIDCPVLDPWVVNHLRQ